jgi:uncharacterized protein YjbJ (UPF0337 family)
MNTLKSVFNKDYIEGQWGELKGKIQQNWSKLSEDDVGTLKGNVEEFLGKLQSAYGYSKEEAKQKLDLFGASLMNKIQGNATSAVHTSQDGLNTTVLEQPVSTNA